jgi:CBS domain-containing protein
MKIRNLMIENPRTCRPEDDLSVPARAMWDGDLGSVPVLDREQKVVGMITDRDICMAAYTRGRPLRDMRVRDTMSKVVHACRVDDDVTEAERVMRTKQLRRMPVLDERERLVGILSLNDLALAAMDRRARQEKGLAAEDVVAVLGGICAHRAPSEKEAVMVPARGGASTAPALAT